MTRLRGDSEWWKLASHALWFYWSLSAAPGEGFGSAAPGSPAELLSQRTCPVFGNAETRDATDPLFPHGPWNRRITWKHLDRLVLGTQLSSGAELRICGSTV